jgi:FtsH-binding integral membrane protein
MFSAKGNTDLEANSKQPTFFYGTAKEVRNNFIRKVYTILFIQLCTTFVVAFGMSKMDVVEKMAVAGNFWVLWIAIVLYLGLGITFSFFPNLMRKYPLNYFLVALFTLLMSFIVGVITAFYSTQSVIIAGAITSAVVGALTVYAFFTKTDFTGLGPYLYTALVGLILFGLIFLIFPSDSFPVAHKIYSGIGALLFCLLLVFDTQLIVGGKKNEYSVDDYLLGALHLYLDVINIFLKILSLVGRR